MRASGARVPRLRAHGHGGASQSAALLVSRARAGVRAAAATSGAPLPVALPSEEYHKRLRGQRVIRSSDGAELDITSLWTEGERAVVVFGRSFG